MSTRVVVAGSRLADPRAARPIVDFLLTVEEPKVLLRVGRNTEPGPVETEVARLCHLLAIPLEWHKPPPGGRDQVYFRDIDMVAGADLALCVFAPHQPMEGGTGHLIEKAQDQRVPAYGYTFDGQLRRVGEYDPDNTWGKRAPRG